MQDLGFYYGRRRSEAYAMGAKLFKTFWGACAAMAGEQSRDVPGQDDSQP